jgi:hypothetical protein
LWVCILLYIFYNKLLLNIIKSLLNYIKLYDINLDEIFYSYLEYKNNCIEELTMNLPNFYDKYNIKKEFQIKNVYEHLHLELIINNSKLKGMLKKYNWSNEIPYHNNDDDESRSYLYCSHNDINSYSVRFVSFLYFFEVFMKKKEDKLEFINFNLLDKIFLEKKIIILFCHTYRLRRDLIDESMCSEISKKSFRIDLSDYHDSENRRMLDHKTLINSFINKQYEEFNDKKKELNLFNLIFKLISNLKKID